MKKRGKNCESRGDERNMTKVLNKLSGGEAKE